jgi:hypothetical protein
MLRHAMKQFIIVLILLAVRVASVIAQTSPASTGSTDARAAEASVAADSLFIFQPARPLIDTLGITGNYEDSWGADILFSNSGFGIGAFYLRNLSSNLSGFIDLGITGSRQSDEFEQLVNTGDPDYPQDLRVPNKVNRLFTFPLTVGVRYRLLENVLADNLRPYINAGVGPTMIVALPYNYDFFPSIPHASVHFTGGGFVGLGADVGGKKPSLGINVRYYYIPFKPGLESIRNEPITDFGGLFLTLNVGLGH